MEDLAQFCQFLPFMNIQFIKKWERGLGQGLFLKGTPFWEWYNATLVLESVVQAGFQPSGASSDVRPSTTLHLKKECSRIQAPSPYHSIIPIKALANAY